MPLIIATSNAYYVLRIVSVHTSTARFLIELIRANLYQQSIRESGALWDRQRSVFVCGVNYCTAWELLETVSAFIAAPLVR